MSHMSHGTSMKMEAVLRWKAEVPWEAGCKKAEYAASARVDGVGQGDAMA